jgi:hypothetical protein
VLNVLTGNLRTIVRIEDDSGTVALHAIYFSSAVREGRHADAQGLLIQVIEGDEQNELAWLWLSGTVEDPQPISRWRWRTCWRSTPTTRLRVRGLTWLQLRYRSQAALAADGEWQSCSRQR